MRPIQVPADWDDDALLTFEQFCTLIDRPPRTVRAWRQRGVGPEWVKIDGCGQLYITVREVRRFLRSARAVRVRRRAVRVVRGGAAS